MVAIIRAEDKDAGVNANLNYVIQDSAYVTRVVDDEPGGEDEPMNELPFVLDPRNGSLTVNASLLNYEKVTHRTFSQQ